MELNPQAKLQQQVLKMVSPLLQVFKQNVKNLSIVSISIQKVLELIQNNNTCLEQMSILIHKQFYWSKVMEEIFINMGIFLNNLYRWISQISFNRFRISQQIQNKKPPSFYSGKCQRCQEFLEMLKIKNAKQSLLGTQYGVMSLSYRDKAQQQQEEDLFPKEFWEKLNSNEYQRNKHSLFAKADPYLTHWYTQEKLKKNKFDQMSSSIEKQNAINESRVNCEQGKIDEIINSLLMNVKGNLSNVSIFKRMKCLMVTLQNLVSEYNDKNTKLTQQDEDLDNNGRKLNRNMPNYEKIGLKLKIKQVNSEKTYIYSNKKNSSKDTQKPANNKKQKNRRQGMVSSFRDSLQLSEISKIKSMNSIDSEKQHNERVQMNQVIKQIADESQIKLIKRRSKNQRKSMLGRQYNPSSNNMMGEIKKMEQIAVQCELLKDYKEDKGNIRTKKQIQIKFEPMPNAENIKTRQMNTQSKKKGKNKVKIAKKNMINQSKPQIDTSLYNQNENDHIKQNIRLSRVRFQDQNKDKNSLKSNVSIGNRNQQTSLTSLKASATNLLSKSTRNNLLRPSINAISDHSQNKITLNKTLKSIKSFKKPLQNRNIQSQSLHRQNRTSYTHQQINQASDTKQDKKQDTINKSYKERVLRTEYQFFSKSKNSQHFDSIISSGKAQLQHKIKQVIENSQKYKKGQKQQLNTMLNPIKNQKNHRSIFQMSDLEIFGGINESYNWQHKKYDTLKTHQLTEQQNNKIHEIMRHIINLSSFASPIYEQTISFLVFPYSTIESKKSISSTVHQQDIEKSLQAILRRHKSKCGSIQCWHIMKLQEKINFM